MFGACRVEKMATWSVHGTRTDPLWDDTGAENLVQVSYYSHLCTLPNKLTTTTVGIHDYVHV